MKRRFIITALSDKNGEYCVSGIGANDNKHYRLCSDNVVTHGAVNHDLIFYETGIRLQVLDICEVEVVGNIPDDFQPENILVDWNIKPVYIDRISKNVVELSVTDFKHVFFNTWRKINIDDLNQNGDPRHSLELIKVDKLLIDYKVPFYGGKAKLYGKFIYKGIVYNEISITDPHLKSLFSQKNLGIYPMNNPVLLLSLGPKYSDGYNYKLIASVIM